MPLGTGGGGGGGGLLSGAVQNIHNSISPPMSAQQQAALNYLQGASGLNLSQYNSSLSALNAQRNAYNSAYGAAAGAANRDYGLTIRGINDDLRFGNQLRGQEQYRNVDLGRERSNVELGSARGIWDILRQDLTQRRGFANRGFGLANQRTTGAYNTGMRGVGTDAMARGAMRSAGAIGQFGDVRQQRDIGLGENRLQLDQTMGGIDTEYRYGARRWNDANANYRIDQKTFDSLAKTYGIQAAQALAQAALGRDRAASNRSSATSGAAASRAASLANLAGGQSSAYNQYMQNQMGLMQQLYGLG